MNENTSREPAPAGADPLDEAYFEQLSQWAESEDFTIPDDAVVHPAGPGEQPGREFLAQYLTPADLDAAVRRGRGRPSLSGRGASPKRQVTLPADLDDRLDRVAKAQGRKPADVMREAIETYLQTA